jgi:hypothetical protein
MKKLAIITLLALVLTAFSFRPVSADPGGTPATHGVDGRTFGGAVSGLAQSAPGAVAAHVSSGASASSMAGGMPAVHGVDGRTFGGVVSGLAQSAPGAVASHVSGK